jgi:hypothetical protein
MSTHERLPLPDILPMDVALPWSGNCHRDR